MIYINYLVKLGNYFATHMQTHEHYTTKPQQKHQPHCAVLENIGSNFNKPSVPYFPKTTSKAQGCLSTMPQKHTYTRSNQTQPNVNQIKAALVRESKEIVVLL